MAISNNNKPSRNRRRGGRNAPQNGNLKKILFLTAMPIIVLGVGGFIMSQQLKIEKMGADYCYARKDQHQAAIFLDSSMQQDLSVQQYRDYQTGFDQLYINAPANARISIFTTASDTNRSLPKPVVSICKPAATVAEQDALDAPSQLAPYLARQAVEAEEEYNVIVEQVLRDAQDASKAAHDSPILEKLQAISRYDGFTSPHRSLSVISDGIQNSEIARFCSVKGDLPPFSIFKTQRRYAHIEPRSFSGVDVQFLLVESYSLPQATLPYCTNNEIRKWWPAYFKGNGAANVEVTRLRHGGGQ